MAKFQKGNPGRPPGSRNKVTRSAREAFALGFARLGDVDALVEWAQQPKNRTEFYRLYARLIPTDVHHSGALTLPRIEKIIHEPLTSDEK